MVLPSQRSTSSCEPEPGEASDRLRSIKLPVVELSFPAFRGMLGDGGIRRSIPRSGPFFPLLHHHFSRDLSPIVRTILSGPFVHLRGVTSIAHGCISVTG